MATSKGTPMNDAVKNGADNAQGGATGMLKWLWLSLAVVVLDQISKWVIVFLLEHGEVVPVIPTFNLTHVYNPGAAWSFLANAGGWQRWFFSAVAAVVSVLLVGWLRKIPRTDWWVAMAVALILGGALGNLIDRVLLGHVIDFLDFYWPPADSWSASHFPAFNVADCGITVGAAMLIIDMIRNPGK